MYSEGALFGTPILCTATIDQGLFDRKGNKQDHLISNWKVGFQLSGFLVAFFMKDLLLRSV